MTLQEAIDRVDRSKPNKFTFDEKVKWISELDGMLYLELLRTHHLSRDEHDHIREWCVKHGWADPLNAGLRPTCDECCHHGQHSDGMVFEGYDATTDLGTELIVPFPYTDIYQYYLMSEIDLANGETDRYANDRELFNNAYLTFSDYFTRKYMPKQAFREYRL